MAVVLTKQLLRGANQSNAGCVGTLTFEYCPLKTRALGLGLVVIGYTVGTLLGGYAAPPGESKEPA